MALARPLLLAALLLTTLAASAAAQEDAQEPAAVEVWDTPRSVEGLLRVDNNTTLVVRGATIHVKSVLVTKGSTLVLESTPEAPAELRANDNETGWSGTILGTLELRGLPEAPVVLDGIGGEALIQSDKILFRGGFNVVGLMEGQHVRIVNFTGGIDGSHHGTIQLEDVEVASEKGVAFLLGFGNATFRRASFLGTGAGLWSTFYSNITIEDALFDGSAAPIRSEGDLLRLKNVTIRDPESCVRGLAGIVEIEDVTCEGYTMNGIVSEPGASALRRATVRIDGLRVSTDNESAGAAINFVRGEKLTVVSAHIGPVPRVGIRVESAMFDIREVTFQGVGAQNVLIVDPVALPPAQRIGDGEAGGQGWLTAGYRTRATVMSTEGTPADQAVIAYVDEQEGKAVGAHRTNAAGQAEPMLLPALLVDVNGTAYHPTYTVKAYAADGKARWERTNYTPDGQGLFFRLEPVEEVGTQGDRRTPVSAVTLLVAGLAAAAILPRKRLR